MFQNGSNKTSNTRGKQGRFGNHIATVDATGGLIESKDRLENLGQAKTINSRGTTQNKHYFQSNNIACLSSPYLNKGNESYKNIQFNKNANPDSLKSKQGRAIKYTKGDELQSKLKHNTKLKNRNNLRQGQ